MPFIFFTIYLGCCEHLKFSFVFQNDKIYFLRKILAQGGVLGLWRGCWPNVQRAALVNLGDLSTYDSMKSAILDNTTLEDNYITHCMASGCAGLVTVHLFGLLKAYNLLHA